MWYGCSAYGRLQPRSRRIFGDARRVLEQVIFPAIYTDTSVRTVLFVGVGPYTSWYPTVFRTRPHLTFPPSTPTRRLRAGASEVGTESPGSSR
jgi:hypothetical protein